MDVFLAKVEPLLPVLGQDFLKPIAKTLTPPRKKDLLFCKIKNVIASGRLTESGFLVLKLSKAVQKERPSVKKYPYPSILRAQLSREGILTLRKDKFIFSKTTNFPVPALRHP